MRRLIETKYFEFSQNNTGGYFKLHPPLGHYVLVEALELEHAMLRAAQLGIDLEDTNEISGCRWSADSHGTDLAHLYKYFENPRYDDMTVSVYDVFGNIERHQLLLGHVYNEGEDVREEIKKRKNNLELQDLRISHRCDLGLAKASYALKDKEDGRIFFLSDLAIKILDL